VVIEAVELRLDNWDEMCEHAGVGRLEHNQPQGTFIDADGRATQDVTNEIGLLIPTLEGIMLARQGDFVIRGVQGELYPCKPDIFAKTYEPAD
jgi:hypothetical protein